MSADMEQGNDSDASLLIEQLGHAFLELEARKEAFENNIQWDEIKQHFLDLEAALKKKLEVLEAKERDYEKKEVEVHTQLAQREEEVASKEQDLLDRVQELKDAAVAAIVEARANHQATSLESVDEGENKDNKQAKAIADEWRPKLARAGTDAANGNSLEAKAFLQLLSTFRIASEFDEEELCKLVLAVAQHRQAPELCRSLGLTHKVPDIVELLISDGKQIAAVHFIQAFLLNERFAPVPLLKAYLKDLRRNSQGKVGGSVAGEKNDANAQELAALKAVIKCVEEYKLESDYPLDPLQRRVAQLDKLKTDRKRTGQFGKRQQPKKSRTNGGNFALRPSVGVSAAASSIMSRQLPPVRGPYPGIPERYPHASAIAYDYQLPGQTIYSQQVNDQRLPFYARDDRVTTPNYGSYIGGGGGGHLHSPHQPYM